VPELRDLLLTPEQAAEMDAPGSKDAAVLVPLYPDLVAVFTERRADLPQHAGEISFPGGRQDHPDEDLRATALREAEEEIGLDPRSVDVVGALPSVHTFVSAILVVPFVGVLEAMPALTVSDAEIDEVLVFPLMRLADAESVVHYDLAGGRTWKGFAFELDGATIWGATGWMLHTLLETIRKDTPWPIP
jgi:8-oxo-dGTP pyrophosphatase MutT (NUDIX family)